MPFGLVVNWLVQGGWWRNSVIRRVRPTLSDKLNTFCGQIIVSFVYIMDSYTLYFDHVILNGIQCYNHGILNIHLPNIQKIDLQNIFDIKFPKKFFNFQWKRNRVSFLTSTSCPPTRISSGTYPPNYISNSIINQIINYSLYFKSSFRNHLWC